MSDLKGDLTEIKGIGPKKADRIIAVLQDHDLGGESRLLEKAREAAARRDDREAATWLRRDA